MDQELLVYQPTFSKENYYQWMITLKCNFLYLFRIDYDFRGEGVRKPLLKKLD